MSKNNQNNNTMKNPKTSHKRNNSNSYNQNIVSSSNTNTTSEVMNNTSNLGNQTMNQNLFNSNVAQNAGLTQGYHGVNNSNPNNITPNLGNNTLNSNNLNLLNSNAEDLKSLLQKIDCVGKVPTARFGHTIVLVSPVKIILFGGAVGDTRNFQFTNDTYVLNLITKIWLKLEGKFYK
jgi:hypothetical protein